MQEVINFLIGNPDVLEKLKNGTVSLLGVSFDEVKVIIDVLTGDSSIIKAGYWNS